MRIGIDVRATVGRRTGIGVCIESLLEHLTAIDAENEYLLYMLCWNPLWHSEAGCARTAGPGRSRLPS